MNILNKYFDKIYLITLENSIRLNRMQERLEGVDYEIFYGVNGGSLDKTPYIEMGSKQTRGQLGCTLSHYKLYEKICNENYEKVLILEDDCLINSYIENLGIYMQQLPTDWGLFYLGWSNGGLHSNYSSNLFEISSNSFVAIEGTHCIAIRPHFAKRLLELNKRMSYTADGLLTESVKQYGLKTYVAIPKLAIQDNIDSVTCDMDKRFGF